MRRILIILFLFVGFATYAQDPEYEQTTNNFTTYFDLIRTGLPGVIVTVDGFYDSADGGGGRFVWRSRSVKDTIFGIIKQVPGRTIGRWERIISKSINLKWFGAKGVGATEYAYDSAALQNSTDWLNAHPNSELVIPEGKFCYRGKGMPLRVPSNIHGSGPACQVWNIDPDGSTYYNGVVWYLTSYFTDSVHNPIVKGVPKYAIQNAERGNLYVVLTSIADTSHFSIGEVIFMGSRKFQHANSTNKPRLDNSDINAVNRIKEDTLFMEKPISQDIVADATTAYIYDVNSGTTTSAQLGVDFMSRDISIHDLTMGVSRYNEITGGDLVVEGNVAQPVQFGGTYNSTFYNLTYYAAISSNLFGHVVFHDIKMTAERKILDLGFNSNDVTLDDIQWNSRKDATLDTSSEAGFIYLNDNAHNIYINNLKAVGAWNGKHLFAIGESAKYLFINNVYFDITGFRTNNVDAISMTENPTTPINNIYMSNIFIRIDTIGRWLDMRLEPTTEYQHRNIVLEHITFRGYADTITSPNSIRIHHGGNFILNDIDATGVDTVKVYGNTTDDAAIISSRFSDAYLNISDVSIVKTGMQFRDAANVGLRFNGPKNGLMGNSGNIFGINSWTNSSGAAPNVFGKNALNGVVGDRNSAFGLGTFRANSGTINADSTIALGTGNSGFVGGAFSGNINIGTGSHQQIGTYFDHSISIGNGNTVGSDGLTNFILLGHGVNATANNQFKMAPSVVNWNIGGIAYVIPTAQATAGQVLTATSVASSVATLQWSTAASNLPVTGTVASDQTSTIATLGNATGASVSITAGQKYHLTGIVLTSCGAAGGGVKLGLNTAATVTIHAGTFKGQAATVSSIKWAEVTNMTGTSLGFWNNAVASYQVEINCHFTATTSGTVTLQFASQTAGETSTIRTGTTLKLEKEN